MKSNEFTKFLRDFETLLASSDTSNSSAGLAAFQDVLTEAKTKQVAAVLKALANISFEPAGYFQSSNLGDAVQQLTAVRNFARLYSKKTIADDLDRVLQFCKDHASADASKFVGVAKTALVAKPKKTAASRTPTASDDDIGRYLARLDETFGFEPDFDRVFGELKSDKTMKAPQLKKLAKLFTKLPAKSGPDALKSIYRRHANILEADKHKAAVGGRVG